MVAHQTVRRGLLRAGLELALGRLLLPVGVKIPLVIVVGGATYLGALVALGLAPEEKRVFVAARDRVRRYLRRGRPRPHAQREQVTGAAEAARPRAPARQGARAPNEKYPCKQPHRFVADDVEAVDAKVLAPDWGRNNHSSLMALPRSPWRLGASGARI